MKSRFRARKKVAGAYDLESMKLNLEACQKWPKKNSRQGKDMKAWSSAPRQGKLQYKCQSFHRRQTQLWKAFSSLDAWLQVYLDLVLDLILVADLLSKAHFDHHHLHHLYHLGIHHFLTNRITKLKACPRPEARWWWRSECGGHGSWIVSTSNAWPCLAWLVNRKHQEPSSTKDSSPPPSPAPPPIPPRFVFPKVLSWPCFALGLTFGNGQYLGQYLT